MEELHIAVKQGGKTESTGIWWDMLRIFSTHMGDHQRWLAGCYKPDVHRIINTIHTETWNYCMLAKNKQACPTGGL
jgi:hypothetical protein